MPAFSYAQAAQGLSRASQNKAKTPVSNPIVQDLPDINAKKVNQEPAVSDLSTSQHSIRSSQVDLSPKVTAEAGALGDSKDVDSVNGNAAAATKPSPSLADGPSTSLSSPSFGASPNLTAQENTEVASTQLKNGTDSTDSQVQTPAGSDKFSVSSEKKKSKDEDADWERISSPSIPTEKDMKPAPPPAVNFWAQRKAEQEAKAKELATHKASAASAKTKPTNENAPEASKKKPVETSAALAEKDLNGTRRKSQYDSKNAHGDQESSTSVSRPTSRHNDIPATEPLSAVGDPELWPTPETAISDDRRRSSQLDRPEKPEAKPVDSKTQKWVTMPFVPTAVFNTPLPPAARGRGGRGGRGRDATTRGGSSSQHTATSDRAEATGTMGPPPVPKQQEQERGRRTDTSRGGRAASVPTETRRNQSGSTQSGGSRRPDTAQKEKTPYVQSRVNQGITDNSTRPDTDLPNQKLEASVNTTTVPEGQGTAPNVPNAHTSSSTFGNTHAHPHMESNWKTNQAEWNRPTSSGGRQAEETGRDKFSAKPRDAGRERPEHFRETWRDRDRDAPWDSSIRRDSRPERGRGGGRGGRGSHQSYNAPHTAPLPQQPFPTSKSNSYTENRPRPQQQAYPSMTSVPNTRPNPRSQSIPTGLPGSYVPYTVLSNGMLMPMTPVQPDSAVYSSVPASAPVTPMMPGLQQYGLFSMLSGQIQYYFSIENLAKDVFLRQHMDSQGWVPLSIVGDFPRMKALTTDENLLRSVCKSSPDVDHLEGVNGEPDLVRRKGDWARFLLPMDQRFAGAQREGPRIDRYSGPPSNDEHHQLRTPSFGSTNQARSHQPHQQLLGLGTSISPVNQHEVNPFETNRSGSMSATRENVASPVEESTPLIFGSFVHHTTENNNAGLNGSLHHVPQASAAPGNHVAPQEGENVFPDQQIADLKLVTDNQDRTTTEPQKPPLTMASRTFSQTSTSNVSQSRSPPSNAARPMIGLRGGAANLEQLEMSQSYGINGKSSSHASEPGTVLWFKDGSQHVITPADESDYESYLDVRQRALSQREHGLHHEDMNVLYSFWSHFLPSNFNVQMYEEFRDLALDDLRTYGVESGCNRLVEYYKGLLTAHTTISDRIAQDIVDMTEKDRLQYRHILRILRAAWRDGAFDLKSRKKISQLLTSDLRAELDK